MFQFKKFFFNSVLHTQRGFCFESFEILVFTFRASVYLEFNFCIVYDKGLMIFPLMNNTFSTNLIEQFIFFPLLICSVSCQVSMDGTVSGLSFLFHCLSILYQYHSVLIYCSVTVSLGTLQSEFHDFVLQNCLGTFFTMCIFKISWLSSMKTFGVLIKLYEVWGAWVLQLLSI